MPPRHIFLREELYRRFADNTARRKPSLDISASVDYRQPISASTPGESGNIGAIYRTGAPPPPTISRREKWSAARGVGASILPAEEITRLLASRMPRTSQKPMGLKNFDGRRGRTTRALLAPTARRSRRSFQDYLVKHPGRSSLLCDASRRQRSPTCKGLQQAGGRGAENNTKSGFDRLFQAGALMPAAFEPSTSSHMEAGDGRKTSQEFYYRPFRVGISSAEAPEDF